MIPPFKNRTSLRRRSKQIKRSASNPRVQFHSYECRDIVLKGRLSNESSFTVTFTPPVHLPRRRCCGKLAYPNEAVLCRRSVSCSAITLNGDTQMGIISWIILGLIAGFIGSKIVNKQGQGFWLNIALGIVGAVVGGFLFDLLGATGVTGLNIYSMIVAIVGAIVVLLIYNTVTGRRSRA